jgi:predicted phage terminase large subunit-like protein
LPVQLDLIDNKSLNKKIGKAEFRRKAQEILGYLRSEYDPFKDDTPEVQTKRKNRALSDPFYFFRTYLPHYFNTKFAPFHYELVASLERRPSLGDSTVVKPVVVAAPREFAKTTITGFGYVLHQIVFKMRHFILLLSDTQDLASDLSGYIYLELCYNERLKRDFGKLVRDNWAVEDYVTLNDVRLLARGRGQRIRGLKHKQHRPDLVIMDDLENDTSARNPQRCKDLLRWINGSAYSGIDVHGNLFIVGTILSQKSALATMVLSKEEPYIHWDRKIYRALTEDGQSLWPAKFSLEVLAEQKRLMGTAAFNREKLNLANDEDSYFQADWFQYYGPEDLVDAEGKGKDLVVVGWYDPSLEVGSQHDYKAIITLGFSASEATYYVLDAWIKRQSLDQAIITAHELHKLYRYAIFGVEDNLFQRLLLKEFATKSKELGIALPVSGRGNYLAKETRIAGLSPLVERGNIKFREHHSDQNLLVEQLLFFPQRGMHDDGPDALAGAVKTAQDATICAVDVQVEVSPSYYRPDTIHHYRSDRPRMMH